MKDIDYQKIADILKKVLPEEWSKTVFYAEYTTGSYSMKYYVDLGDGKYVDCYSLKQFSKIQLIRAWIEIDKEISEIRKELEENDKWSVLTIQIDRSGKFKADYDYDNHEEATITYHEKWKRQYLK